MDRVDGAARRRGPRRRRLARTLVGAALAAVALVSPLESGLLPGPANVSLGESEALAQQSTKDGTADDCPSTPFQYQPDSADPSLCVLELPACPMSPFNTGQLMKLSMPFPDVWSAFPSPSYSQDPGYPAGDYTANGYGRYPEFCEEWVRQDTSPGDYATCVDLTGYAVRDDGTVCRIFHPIRCVAGLHQHGSQTCKAMQRRSWTCDAGYLPSNRFLTCYLPTAYSESDAVPACTAGAPDFGVFESAARACEAYVRGDALRDPSERQCATDYSTGAIPNSRWAAGVVLQVHTANRNWCGFDAAALDPQCHDPATTPTCSRQSSLCLKRASRTGGCDQIIDTIRCRGHQDALRRGVLNAAQVQAAGCSPCAALPFSQPTCGVHTTLSRYRDHSVAAYILRCGYDFSTFDGQRPGALDVDRGIGECKPDLAGSAAACSDPPSGAVEWTSTHFSNLAVVNSPVTLRIVDLPFDFGQIRVPVYQRRQDPPVRLVSVPTVQYRDSIMLDRAARELSQIDPARRYTSLAEMAQTECRLRGTPLFNIIVTELWPDTPEARDEITKLFGSDSLAWWNALGPEEQRRRTAARGPSPPTAVPCEQKHPHLRVAPRPPRVLPCRRSGRLDCGDPPPGSTLGPDHGRRFRGRVD